MSLAQTLSALREMILDIRELPSDIGNRRAFLRGRFPLLTEAECEDLAQIPPGRLALYTESIFASERSLLRAKFPISFALIKRAAKNCGEVVDLYELVRSLHDWRPWRSRGVPDLATNFAAFIVSEYPAWVIAEPLLEDALRLECVGMEVARAPNDQLFAPGNMQIASALTISLETLLRHEVFIPQFASFSVFKSNIIDLFYAVRAQRELPADFQFAGGAWFMVCGRDARYVVQWAGISAELFEVLGKLPRSNFFTLNHVAELFLERFPTGYDESIVAKTLLGDIVALNSKGALILRPPE